MIETPPLWITSPAVPVEAGQLVRIHGWVNIPAAITGSVDGLMVVDSLGGDDLAERIDKTAGWKEFTLYRAAWEPATVSVTFALSGLGEARIDDVTIQVLKPALTGRSSQRAAGFIPAVLAPTLSNLRPANRRPTHQARPGRIAFLHIRARQPALPQFDHLEQPAQLEVQLPLGQRRGVPGAGSALRAAMVK